MGLQNWFSRVLMSTWFREISVIDAENLPSDRGAVIVSGIQEACLTTCSRRVVARRASQI